MVIVQYYDSLFDNQETLEILFLQSSNMGHVYRSVFVVRNLKAKRVSSTNCISNSGIETEGPFTSTC